MAMPNGATYTEFKIGSKHGNMVRLSYAGGLFVPRKASETDKVEKYGGTLIFAKTAKDIIDLCKQAVIDCAVAKWGDGAKERLKDESIKNPILDGGGKAGKSKKTGKFNPGMSNDVFFIRANSGLDMPPQVFLPNKQEVDPRTKNKIYSGCYGAAVINAYAWENDKGGLGVSFGIKMFQKLEEGDRLGGGPVDPTKYFETVDEDAQGSAPEETQEGAGSGALFA